MITIKSLNLLIKSISANSQFTLHVIVQKYAHYQFHDFHRHFSGFSGNNQSKILNWRKMCSRILNFSSRLT